jgi:hypothetical protein
MEEVALEAVAREELVQQAAQDVCIGTGMEATSHYVPTAERMGSTSLTTASCYQRTRAKSRQTSLMGSLCMSRRWNDKDQGKLVIA